MTGRGGCDTKCFENCTYFTAAKYLRRMEQLAGRYLRETGLPVPYNYILDALDRYEEIDSIMSISQALGYDRSTVSRMVKQLEAGGLVALRAEGRRTRVELTEKGRRLDHDVIKKCLATYYEEVTELFGAESRKEMTRLLVRNTELIEQVL